MNKIEFAQLVNAPSGIIYTIGSTEIDIIIPINGHPLRATIQKNTSSDHTQKNADAIRAWIAANSETISAWQIERKAYLKSPEGIKSIAMASALELAKTAGLHEEHGSSRGDWHTLSVKDVVFEKKPLAALHASGKLLALVSDFRKRVYANCYKHAPGTREDFYLVGTNENGVSFCHAVSRNCTTVTEAVAWIWGGAVISARHGDVAITSAKYSGAGEGVMDITIHDSHHFTGEMHKNGSTQIRNGTLHHVKNQHPDVIIGNEWMRVIIARRAVAGGSSD